MVQFLLSARCFNGVIDKSDCHDLVHMAHGKHGAILALSRCLCCAGLCRKHGAVWCLHATAASAACLGIAWWSSMLLEEGSCCGHSVCACAQKSSVIMCAA